MLQNLFLLKQKAQKVWPLLPISILSRIIWQHCGQLQFLKIVTAGFLSPFYLFKNL